MSKNKKAGNDKTMKKINKTENYRYLVSLIFLLLGVIWIFLFFLGYRTDSQIIKSDYNTITPWLGFIFIFFGYLILPIESRGLIEIGIKKTKKRP